ncbi:MAG: nitroreductase family protein, partial [Chloroflexota bacterium]|nr:nitroreductase family protein [Chloroflexota bacterium]
MNIIEAIRTRKSVRGYKPVPVPREVIQEILEVAGRSPSAMNTQPWEFTVIAGEVLNSVRKATVELLNSGKPPCPEHLVVGWS